MSSGKAVWRDHEAQEINLKLQDSEIKALKNSNEDISADENFEEARRSCMNTDVFEQS